MFPNAIVGYGNSLYQLHDMSNASWSDTELSCVNCERKLKKNKDKEKITGEI
jgi:hypothetical protein